LKLEPDLEPDLDPDPKKVSERGAWSSLSVTHVCSSLEWFCK